jgi:hypothetical protein
MLPPPMDSPAGEIQHVRQHNVPCSDDCLQSVCLFCPKEIYNVCGVIVPLLLAKQTNFAAVALFGAKVFQSMYQLT